VNVGPMTLRESRRIIEVLADTDSILIVPNEASRIEEACRFGGLMPVLRIMLALLAFSVLMESCERPSPVGPSQVSPADALISALQAKGANVTRGATLPRQSHPYFSVNGQTISVNRSDVTVFEYMTAGAADNDAAQVAPAGSPIGHTQVTWVGPPQFYKTDRLIVLYVGSNGSVLAPLEAVLGSPFAPMAGKVGQCGLGPITVSPNAHECATVAPQCPAQRPPDARTLLTFSTCSFGSNEQSCSPVLNPVCPRESQIVAMTLINPNRRDQGPCGFAAVVHING
jgi:hypothetical protein